MPSRINTLLSARSAARKGLALKLAQETLERLKALGVTAVVGGSLAKGHFLSHSDVDFIILDTGGISEGRILAEVETVMNGFPFDLIHLSDIAEESRPFMTEAVLHASDIRTP